MSKDTADLDPTTIPFWAAVEEHRFILQLCTDCKNFQFYPRSLCIACGSDSLQWADASGFGEIYSQTTVRIETRPGLKPPFRVAIIALDEGVRVTANIIGKETRVGDRVRLLWREVDPNIEHPYAFELVEAGQ